MKSIARSFWDVTELRHLQLLSSDEKATMKKVDRLQSLRREGTRLLAAVEQ
jgi:hypothetical protein